MSGHASFAPIGNQPMFQPNQIGNIGNVENNIAPGGIGQPVQPEAQPEAAPQQPNARSISHRLDALLLTAAKTAVASVDAKTIDQTTANIAMSDNDRKELNDAAQNAKKTLEALSKYTGREIGSAFESDADGFFDFKAGDPVAKAINAAIDAQAKLAEMLHDLAGRADVTGKAFEKLDEMAFQCDRRSSEITTLAIQLADSAAKPDIDPEIAAKFDMQLGTLIQKQAVEMHGTAQTLEKLSQQLSPPASKPPLTSHPLPPASPSSGRKGCGVRHDGQKGRPQSSELQGV